MCGEGYLYEVKFGGEAFENFNVTGITNVFFCARVQLW